MVGIKDGEFDQENTLYHAHQRTEQEEARKLKDVEEPLRSSDTSSEGVLIEPSFEYNEEVPSNDQPEQPKRCYMKIIKIKTHLNPHTQSMGLKTPQAEQKEHPPLLATSAARPTTIGNSSGTTYAANTSTLAPAKYAPNSAQAYRV